MARLPAGIVEKICQVMAKFERVLPSRGGAWTGIDGQGTYAGVTQSRYRSYAMSRAPFAAAVKEIKFWVRPFKPKGFKGTSLHMTPPPRAEAS